MVKKNFIEIFDKLGDFKSKFNNFIKIILLKLKYGI